MRPNPKSPHLAPRASKTARGPLAYLLALALVIECAVVGVLAMAWVNEAWSAAPATTQGPSAWLEAFRRAYVARDLTTYGELLADDFRFKFGDPADRERYPAGWGKDDELQSARHLFEGFVNAQGVAMPRAQGIALDLGRVRYAPDPEHPGDPEHYALAVADDVRLVIAFENGGTIEADGRHAFWLVRGDADSTCDFRDAGCWRVRRWVEQPAETLLALRETGVHETSGDSSSVALLADARPFDAAPNPARSGETVRIAFALRGAADRVTATVYDVAGRRVATLEGRPAGGGLWSLAWDGRTEHGDAGRPGVYFARVTAGPLTKVVRLVRVP